MIRGAVVVSVMLAGCFSRPEFKPGDGGGSGSDGSAACQPSRPSPSGVYVDSNNGQWTAHMIPARMTFANDGNRYPFPIELRTASENLISEDAGCGAEDQVGVAVFPIYSVAGNQAIQQGEDHQLLRPIVGPAYSELVVEWGYSIHCSATQLTPHGGGTSTFSFFPDGRIVRNDRFHPVDNIKTFTVGCPCDGSSTSFAVTSYIGLAADQLMSYTDAMTGDTGDLPMGDGNGRIGGCFLTQEMDNIALQWAPGLQTRLRRASTDEVAWVLDFYRGSNIASSDEPTGRTMMMLRQDGDCAQLNAELESHMAPTRLSIGGMAVDPGPNGYYDHAALVPTNTGPVTVMATNGRIESGFSIRVRFPGYSAVATDRMDGRVFWQHEADDTFFLTFRDSLDSGDSFSITPECALDG